MIPALEASRPAPGDPDMLAVFTATEAVKDPQGHVLFHAGEEIRWHADRWDQPICVYRDGRLARTFGPYHTPAIFVGLRQGALRRPESSSAPSPPHADHGLPDPVTPISARWEGEAHPSVM
jgi:hypothetical protein